MESMEKNHAAPFKKEEEKIIERISAQEELKKIIQFSDDTSMKKKPQDVIMAAKDYIERLSAVDKGKAEELNALIEKAEKEFHKRRIAEVGLITKIDTSKKSFKKSF